MLDSTHDDFNTPDRECVIKRSRKTNKSRRDPSRVWDNCKTHFNSSPPTPWGHEACRWSLKPKPLPPLVSSHYPKLILRGEVYLSPPPLHWVVAPAFNICSDYSRSRNLMLSPRARIKILTFFIFHFRPFLGRVFILRRFSLEVLSNMKCVKWRILENIYKTQWNINVFLGVLM